MLGLIFVIWALDGSKTPPRGSRHQPFSLPCKHYVFLLLLEVLLVFLVFGVAWLGFVVFVLCVVYVVSVVCFFLVLVVLVKKFARAVHQTALCSNPIQGKEKIAAQPTARSLKAGGGDTP